MKSVALAAALIGLLTCPAAADVIVDQEYVASANKSYTPDYPGDYMAQTFTVRNDGQLTSVGLQLYFRDYYQPPNYYAVTDDWHFHLTRTNTAGEPILDNPLATYSIAAITLPQSYDALPMREIDLANQHIQVHAGDVLALVLSSNYTYYSHTGNQDYGWNNSFSDAISGGRFYLYAPKVFGARWFYQWRLDDPTQSWDAGYRITINTIPEPSTVFLTTLAIVAPITTRRRRF